MASSRLLCRRAAAALLGLPAAGGAAALAQSADDADAAFHRELEKIRPEREALIEQVRERAAHPLRRAVCVSPR